MFVEGKACLTNLIALYSEVTRLVDEGRKVGVYLDLVGLLMESSMMSSQISWGYINRE